MTPFIDNDFSLVDDRAVAQEFDRLRMEGGWEAFEYTAAAILKFLKNLAVVGQNMVGLWDQFKRADGTNRTLSVLEHQVKNLPELLEKHHHMTLARVAFPCPDGFKGDYPGYVDTMVALSSTLPKNALTFADQFRVQLTEFINSSSSRMTLKNPSKQFEATRKLREAENQALEKFFTSGSNQRLPFEDIFPSKQVIHPTLEASTRLFKDSLRYDPVKLRTDAVELAKRLEMVADIQRKTPVTKDTRIAYMNIAEGAMETARQYEHLAKWLVRCEITAVVGGNMITRLEQLK